jgi:hypothetical protein
MATKRGWLEAGGRAPAIAAHAVNKHHSCAQALAGTWRWLLQMGLLHHEPLVALLDNTQMAYIVE